MCVAEENKDKVPTRFNNVKKIYHSNYILELLVITKTQFIYQLKSTYCQQKMSSRARPHCQANDGASPAVFVAVAVAVCVGVVAVSAVVSISMMITLLFPTICGHAEMHSS